MNGQIQPPTGGLYARDYAPPGPFLAVMPVSPGCRQCRLLPFFPRSAGFLHFHFLFFMLYFILEVIIWKN
jgi:hypothetical protein